MKSVEDKYSKLYKKTFKKLNNTTPLVGDCGRLCDKKCCSGSENDGMLLFPGEEYLYHDKNWCSIKDTNIVLSDGYKIKLLVCKGNCPRNERPLSCRIFPVTPNINEFGRVDFRLDPKALGICPIACNPREYPIEEDFVECLYKAFPTLLKDERIVEFIEILSDQYNEEVKFINNFVME